MKSFPAFLALLLAAGAAAQTPDVQVKFDVRANYRTEVGGNTALRWYDTLARFSTIGLQFTLEPGFRATVTQKLQRIPNDGDTEQLDEYYVEDEGNWKVGKQVLPFGAARLFRESVLAARSDTTFIFAHLPVRVAACDGGPGKPRGVVARFGTRLGVSGAVGDHLGVSAGTMAVVRRPEDAFGAGRGFRRAYGLDYGKVDGIFTIEAEWLALRSAEMQGQEDENVFDLSVSLRPSKHRMIQLGLSRRFSEASTFIRLLAEIRATDALSICPIVRYKDGRVFDFSVAVNARF